MTPGTPAQKRHIRAVSALRFGHVPGSLFSAFTCKNSISPITMEAIIVLIIIILIVDDYEKQIRKE